MMSLLRRIPRLPVLLAAVLCLLTGTTAPGGHTWCFDGSGKARAVTADGGSCSPEKSPGWTNTPRSAATLCGYEGNKASRCLDVSADAHWRAPRNRPAGAKIVLLPAVMPFDRAAVATISHLTFRSNLNPHTPPRTPDLILLQKTTVLRV